MTQIPEERTEDCEKEALKRKNKSLEDKVHQLEMKVEEYKAELIKSKRPYSH